jgi:hypothetical protein
MTQPTHFTLSKHLFTLSATRGLSFGANPSCDICYESFAQDMLLPAKYELHLLEFTFTDSCYDLADAPTAFIATSDCLVNENLAESCFLGFQ